MRTLKKTLALVLVVAMVLSFGVIGANAAFTDVTEKTDYSEAITVLTGIGVINGMTATTFAPDGTLTREQAAKIVAYVKLGPTNAQLVSSASSSRFSDVKADRWSAGYIEYCANLGIINGMGDGTFNPEGKLTTAAFTKMLLVAVGFDSESNGFTGAGWAIKVATKAVDAKVYDKAIAISDNVVITRAQACQLALKALFVGKETITSTSTKYVLTVTGSNTELLKLSGNYYNTFDAAKKAATGAQTDAVYGKDYTVASMLITEETVKGSLANDVFTLAKATSTDAFGRPGTSYTVDGESLTFSVNTPVLTYNAPVTSKAIYAALGLTKVPTVTSSVDGVAGSYAIAANDSTVIGGNGSLVEVYKTGTNAYSIVKINTYFDTVKSVKTAKDPTTGVATTTLTLNTSGLTSTKLVDFAKKDAVLYTKANGVLMSIDKATTISGTLTKATNNTDFTIGGVVYKISDTSDLTAAAILGTSNVNMGKNVSFYVDGNNNLIAAVAAVSATTAGTYVKVLASDTSVSGADYMNPTGVITGKVYGLKSDGTYGEFTVNYTTSEAFPSPVAGTTKAAVNTVYEYTVNAAGQLELSAASTIATNAAFTSGATQAPTATGAYYMNAATNYVFYTQTSATNAAIKTVALKTGNANSGEVAIGATVVYEGNVVVAVFVGGEYNDGTQAVDLAYVDATSKTTTTESEVTAAGLVTTTVYTYKAYTAAGDELTLTSKTLNLTASAVYYYNTDKTIGALATTVTGSTTVVGSVIVVDGISYNYNADMVCFIGEDTVLASGQTIVAFASKGTLTHVWVIADAPEA